jgi:hypothetical protein
MCRNSIDGEGTAKRPANSRSPTMLESLAKHLKESTAISLSALTLIKVACAGVILDASGRLKLFENTSIECTKFIVGRLVALAAKEPLPL